MSLNGSKSKSKCWSSRTAEERIHAYAQDWDNLELVRTMHAQEQMTTRNITMPDMHSVLERGHIVEGPKAGARGQCIYKICGRTPNSESREICAVVIPNPKRLVIKIITVMWRDLT